MQQAEQFELELKKDPVHRLSWICVEKERALFVRAPGTLKFFDPGCWAVPRIDDSIILRNKMRKELTVTLLTDGMKMDFSYSAQAYGKPEGEMIAQYLFVARYLGKPSTTPYIEEIRWLTASDEDMELTTEAGAGFIQYLYSQKLIRRK